MTQQPTKGFQADKNADGAPRGANGINNRDGDHSFDVGFESIGNLAGTILSRVKARKEATGANDLTPVARHAQAKPLGRNAIDSQASNEGHVGSHFETSKSSTDERAVFLAR